MKITSNGKFPYTYVATKTQLVVKGKTYTWGEVEVAVPTPPPIYPTEAVCQSLYPCPITPEPPQPPQPPEPPPPTPPPNLKDWWSGWIPPKLDPNIYVNTWAVPGQPIPYGRPLLRCRDEDLKGATGFLNGFSMYNDSSITGGYNYAMPESKLQEFYSYYMNWVPKGGPHHGGGDSCDAAFIMYSVLRWFLGNPCAWYCWGEVSWSAEIPHGFVLVLAYPGTDIPSWQIYMMDPTNKIVPIPFKTSSYTISSFSGFAGG